MCFFFSVVFTPLFVALSLLPSLHLFISAVVSFVDDGDDDECSLLLLLDDGDNDALFEGDEVESFFSQLTEREEADTVVLAVTVFLLP